MGHGSAKKAEMKGMNAGQVSSSRHQSTVPINVGRICSLCAFHTIFFVMFTNGKTYCHACFEVLSQMLDHPQWAQIIALLRLVELQPQMDARIQDMINTVIDDLRLEELQMLSGILKELLAGIRKGKAQLLAQSCDPSASSSTGPGATVDLSAIPFIWLGVLPMAVPVMGLGMRNKSENWRPWGESGLSIFCYCNSVSSV